MPTSLKLLINGRVQGIGYRAFAEKQAEVHDIKGYVKNLPDGRVEVVATGDKMDLDNFIDKLRKGPAFSLVRDIEIDETSLTENFKDFRIEY